MTESELIKEAKNRYPVGTRFKSTCRGDVCEIIKHSFYFSREHIQNYPKGWVFTKPNKWAEIVSYPEGYIPKSTNLLKQIIIW